MKNKILNHRNSAIAIATLLTLSMLASLTALRQTLSQVLPAPGSEIPSYAYLNVAPNPEGVGQTVTLNMFLLISTITSERSDLAIAKEKVNI